MAFLTRFAPSPTGLIHLGTAASALHVWQAARDAGGHVLLRIEDVDQTRCRPEYTDAILDDLEWLGLDWPEPVRIQSQHFADYAGALDQLRERGLLYRCFRTRSEIAAIGLNGPYRGEPLPEREEADRFENGDTFAWRLSLEAARSALGNRYDSLSYSEEVGEEVFERRANPALHGDVVLARKDAPAAYHLAATHDDALQGITHVVRGTDLEDAPHIHVLIQALMGWETPRYRHHDLILAADGKKLSKRDRSKTLASMRAEGLTPQDVRELAGF